MFTNSRNLQVHYLTALCCDFQLALNVFRFLEARDLINSSQTCRLWRYLAEDDVLWRNKNSEIGLPDERFLLQSPSCSPDGFQRSSWKLNYRRHYRIDANWRNGTKRPAKVTSSKLNLIFKIVSLSGSLRSL